MNDESLERILQQGEDSMTEFKSVVSNGYKPDVNDLAKTIASLANTRGGWLLVGVEDDGTVSGTGSTKQADELMLLISQVCQNNIEPSLICGVTKRRLHEQNILLVEVPAFSPSRPHRAGKVYYVRDANRSREAKREELVRLIQSTDYHFDEQPVTGATVEDLDPMAVRSFLATVYQQPVSESHRTRYLTALKCIDRTGVPTVSGVLLLAQEPTLWLTDAGISAVRLPGQQISQTFLDRKSLNGRLLDQVEEASAFILRHVSAPSHVEGLVRVEEGLPPQIIREAVLNAVTHRDYRSASQIRIFVFDDRVEIVNPGELLNQLTLENIRQGGLSQKRNPVLASLLARAGRRENLGFGIPEMVRLTRERGLPEPSIEVSGGHFRLTLWTTRSPRA
jgi:ATP-dependent DNA helicase RecG